MPAARKGDKVVCVGPPDTITEGSSTVFINGKPAARMGDSTEHGGKIVAGVPTVIIGNGTYIYEEDEDIMVPNSAPLIKSESGGTLIFHENLDGHTIRRHVGKTDEQLLQRFETEPDILGSSSYSNIETAQRAVGDVLSRNRDGVQDWLTNSPKPRLTLNETLDYDVGRVIPQGGSVSQSSNKSFVLLVKDPLAPNEYRVHTSFPKPND